MTPDVLEVRDLRVYYHTPHGAVKAVEGVSFDLRAGERFGLVGESGSGKSTIAMALLQLIKPPGRIEGGEVWLRVNEVAPSNRDQASHGSDVRHKDPSGLNLIALSDEQMRQVRLSEIALIPQGAMSSLNPVMRIKDQIVDSFRDHGLRFSKQDLDGRIHDLLKQVGLQPEVAGLYPHELSGGMKQRVCIAIAISLCPRVIIADEPTSALDVVVQRQVMRTLRKVQEDLGASVILMGHDMGLIAQFVGRVGVMYAGRLVEAALANDIFSNSLHPYSRLLIDSLPSLEKKAEFRGIPGLPPSMLGGLTGCPFHTRCPLAIDRCSVDEPALKEVEAGRHVACHLL